MHALNYGAEFRKIEGFKLLIRTKNHQSKKWTLKCPTISDMNINKAYI